MTKTITIDPADVRTRSTLQAPEIPINAYVSNPKAEAAKYGAETLVHIFRDMDGLHKLLPVSLSGCIPYF